MKILIRVHVDPSEKQPGENVWWADSDQLEGFTAVADSLTDLIAETTSAVHELAAERGWLPVDLDYDLIAKPGADSAGEPPAATSGVVSLDNYRSERGGPGVRQAGLTAAMG